MHKKRKLKRSWVLESSDEEADRKKQRFTKKNKYVIVPDALSAEERIKVLDEQIGLLEDGCMDYMELEDEMERKVDKRDAKIHSKNVRSR